MTETPKPRWRGLKPLTDKQQRFVEEYMVDLNASAAAERAGFKGQDRSFNKLMRFPHVRAAVDQALAEKRRAAELEAEDIVAELSRLAFANMLDFVSFRENGAPELDLEAITRDAGAAIQRLTIDYSGEVDGVRSIKRIRISLADKNAALRQLTQHLGLLREPCEQPEPQIRLIRVATGVPRAEDRFDKYGNFIEPPRGGLEQDPNVLTGDSCPEDVEYYDAEGRPIVERRTTPQPPSY